MDGRFSTEDRFVKTRHLVRAITSNYFQPLGKDPNVVGTAFGRRTAQDERTDEPALVVYVMRKIPEEFVPLSVLLPRRIYVGGDAVEVDVVETGPIYPLSFTTRDRPARQGISIAHTAVTAGTFGAVVNDNTDGTTCILSNNHVIANQNAATIGDPIVQPGPADGGTSPADDIATLKRFVTINAAGNTVDAAIGQVIELGSVEDAVKNDLMPVASPDHPAVGLLFAGGCNRSIMNPIDDVMGQLNIAFPAGPGSTTVDRLDMNVEKVGRTTEYTTSTITEIDLTVSVGYDFGPATFNDQFATMWMSDPGDSGSVVCEGGEGGAEDHCGCGSTSAAAAILGVDLSMDQLVEKEFRKRHLQQTEVGRFAVDTFFRNERKLVGRARATKVREEDRTFARYLYDKYADEIRVAMLQPHRSDIRLTSEHLQDAREALGRAKEYLRKDEVEAAEEVLQIAYEAEGKTPAEILEMLNDRGLVRRAQDLVARVGFLDPPKRDWKQSRESRPGRDDSGSGTEAE